MYSVKRILEALGYDGPRDLELGESVTITNEPFMNLVLSRVAMDCISVMHTTTQNGDTLRDPELVFDFTEEPWKLIRYRNDTMGKAVEKTEEGLTEFTDFVNTLDENLEQQGFILAAKEQAEPDES